MWPFGSARARKAVVVFHIDQDGQARGAYFRGDADVLIIDERDPENRVHRMPPSADRWRLRSLTYQGVADAMAAHQAVVNVLDAARRAGLSRLTFAAQGSGSPNSAPPR